MITVQAHPSGAELRAALRERISKLQTNDPVQPVTVAVPSNYAGLALRRALARPTGGQRGGLLNVRFLVLARVVELLGAPILAARGERPLTSVLRGELTRAALENSPGVFAAVVDHPSTEERLSATFRELADLTDEQRTALARSSESVADVVRLFEASQASARGRYYDSAALTIAATESARSGHPALRDLGALIVYAPGPLAGVEEDFIEALASVADVSVLVSLVGDPLADDPIVEQWQEHFVAALPAIEPPIATDIVSAPDADEEVREALRLVLAAIEAGTPLHRIGVLSRHPSPYAALVAGQLDAAGIPWNGSAPRTLAQTVPGRALLGLLDLPASRFGRESVAAWLGATPILDKEHGRPVPAHRWASIARDAAIVRDADEWRTRLDGYAEELQHQLAGLEEADDPAEWRLLRLRRDIDEIANFRVFMDELFTALNRDPIGDWPGFAEWAQRLLERYLGNETALANRLPPDLANDRELAAYRAISEVIVSLSALAEIRPTVDFATFRRVLQRELDQPAGRVGRFGEGLFVGRLSDAAGTDFDRVLLLGMNEGSVPTKGSDDPLVPEATWDAIGGDSRHPFRSRRSRNRSDERRSYLAALAAAPMRTLLAPRADLRGQQGRLRSRWLLESASHLSGQRVTNDDMDRLDAPWHTLISSFDGALAGTGIAASLQERDLRSLRTWGAAGGTLNAHPLATQAPFLRDGWDAQRARRTSQFTRWDGHVNSLPVAMLDRIVGRELSPTSLEKWAACPRQYFFASVLGITERNDPDRLLSISPADKGTLIHDVLDRFITERRPAAPDAAWTEADRARLMAIATEECDRVEQAGLTGARLLWQIDRSRILRDLEAFADVDERYRSTFGVVPVATELSIGGDTPVVVDVGGGRSVRLRGRIDRVDSSPDGQHLVVIDYKSGSAYGYRTLDDDPVQGGRLLQLPVYALGARAHYPTASPVVQSRYWFTRQDIAEGDRFAGYAVDETVESRFRTVLRTIFDGIAGGVFIGDPGAAGLGGAYEHCQWCPYDAVCDADRAREFAEKSSDASLTLFLALRGGAPPPDEGDDA